MIIPSIDIKGGRAVQLRQGREHVLTCDEDPVELAKRFNRCGPVAVIDLDAAMGTGDNLELLMEICRVSDVRVGGGIRTVERGMALLKAGAQFIIIGTAAKAEFLQKFPGDRVLVALDHWDGIVVDQAWVNKTGESVLDRAKRLAPYCAGFLCTFVKDEGGMQGLPMEAALELQRQLPLPVTFGGGVATTEEMVRLARAGLNVQVGMALYTGQLDLTDSVIGALNFDKMGGLIPTVVQDDVTLQVLMSAYSSPESLKQALETGMGVYFSRSRKEVWVKGLTSGNTQELVSCRTDCDLDALVFRVHQKGHACHAGSYSCLGDRVFSLEGLFERLDAISRDRPEGSYTVRLLDDPELLLRKIMEEAFEVTRARTFEECRWEAGDLLYHLMVWVLQRGLSWDDVLQELSSRERRRK